VLDGFIIEGNVLDQDSIRSANVKINPLKKNYPAILVSVLVHLVLVSLLFFFAEKQHLKLIEITPKAIKSYLYKMPIKKVVVKQEELKSENKAKSAIEKTQKLKKIEQKTVSSTQPLSTNIEDKIQKTVKATFSPYKQFDNLRQSINEKMMAQEVSARQQFRSPSVMHGKQIPVPRSYKILSPEQEREQKTTLMSNDISITKYDNGICTIEREQFLGSPVEGSSSAFACGESKFDKSFREHMNKYKKN